MYAPTVSSIVDETEIRRRERRDAEGRVVKKAEIYVGFFRGLPIEIEVVGSEGNLKRLLPQRFQKACAVVVALTGADYRRELEWCFYGYRNGSTEEVADLVVQEIDFAVSDKELELWQRKALTQMEIALNSVLMLLSASKFSSQFSA